MIAMVIDPYSYKKLDPRERKELNITRIELVPNKCYASFDGVYITSDCIDIDETFKILYGAWLAHFESQMLGLWGFSGVMLHVDGERAGYYGLQYKHLQSWKAYSGAYPLGAFLAELRKSSMVVGESATDYIPPHRPYIKQMYGKYLDPVFSELETVTSHDGNSAYYPDAFNFEDFPNIKNVGTAIKDNIVLSTLYPYFGVSIKGIKLTYCEGPFAFECMKRGIPLISDQFTYDSSKNKFSGVATENTISYLFAIGNPKIGYLKNYYGHDDAFVDEFIFTSVDNVQSANLAFNHSYILNYKNISLSEGFLSELPLKQALEDRRSSYVLTSSNLAANGIPIYVPYRTLDEIPLADAIILDPDAFKEVVISSTLPIRDEDKRVLKRYIEGIAEAYRLHANWCTIPQEVPKERKQKANRYLRDLLSYANALSLDRLLAFVTTGLETDCYGRSIVISPQGVKAEPYSPIEGSSTYTLFNATIGEFDLFTMVGGNALEKRVTKDKIFVRTCTRNGSYVSVSKHVIDLYGMRLDTNTYQVLVSDWITIGDTNTLPYPSEPSYEYTPIGGTRIEYTTTAGQDGEVTISYVVYDEDDIDITHLFNTATIGEHFLHKEMS